MVSVWSVHCVHIRKCTKCLATNLFTTLLDTSDGFTSSLSRNANAGAALRAFVWQGDDQFRFVCGHSRSEAEARMYACRGRVLLSHHSKPDIGFKPEEEEEEELDEGPEEEAGLGVDSACLTSPSACDTVIAMVVMTSEMKEEESSLLKRAAWRECFPP